MLKPAKAEAAERESNKAVMQMIWIFMEKSSFGRIVFN